METIPSQKDGVAIPAMATVRTTWSIQLFCHNAEMVPSGIAIRRGTTSSTRFTIYRYILCVRSWSRRRARQRMRTGLLIEPYIGQVLIDVVARADLPSLHIGAQRHDPVPVGYHQLVRLRIEHVLLE